MTSEPEPDEPDERSKLAAEKEQQFRVFDPGVQNSVWVWGCCGATVSNGVLFRETTNKPSPSSSEFIEHLSSAHGLHDPLERTVDPTRSWVCYQFGDRPLGVVGFSLRRTLQ
jgi:hypothetical protein